MAEIDLILDEENELTFQLNVEGNRPGSGAATCRLMIEDGDLSLGFEARKNNNDEISVVIPPLAHIIKEGKYNMSLEVVVDDKYFKPLVLEGNFEKSIVVTATPKIKPRKKNTEMTAALVEVTSSKKSKNIKINKQKPKLKEENKHTKSNFKDEDILQIIKALTAK